MRAPYIAAFSLLLMTTLIGCGGRGETTQPFETTGEALRRQPNVILIMADDMGYECLSENGGESYETPRLDALARAGIRFENAHAQPICTPSRVQLMTGIYNNRNYIRFGLLDPEAQTFGHLFRDAGYNTVIAGKWQLGGGFDSPQHFGFDEYCLWQLTRAGPGRIAPRYPNPGLEINGEEIDYIQGEYGPDIVCDYLCDFIERNQDDPFFVYYPMILPHFPFQPTPASEAWDPSESREYPKREWRNEWFADMVAYTDHNVGRLVDKLEVLGLSDNTIIVFVGDNGTYRDIPSQFNSQTVIGGKGTTRDTGTHVPLIVCWPGTTSGEQVSQSLVDLSDFLPTLADLTSIQVPNAEELDGVSFANEVIGESQSTREYIYCWYQRNGVRETASQHVRTSRFKLYADGRFYDTHVDPNERAPLDTDTLTGDARDAYGPLQAAIAYHTAITRACDLTQNEKRDE